MALELFAGVHVSDLAAAIQWYERLLGGPPSMRPNDHEAAWELAEHRHVFVRDDGERRGCAELFLMVDDLDERVAEISGRGLEPDERDAYPNGVRKVIYRDPDGNEFDFGGMPVD